MRSMVNAANDTYGGMSAQLKCRFTLNGIMNWGPHNNDDHFICNQFCWYGLCGAEANMFTPTHPYVFDCDTGRGKLSNEMIFSFFNILLLALCLNTITEKLLWRTIHKSTTTICESFFHALCIYIQKWANFPEELYVMKEAVSYIAFIGNMEEKQLFNKMRSFNKYARTLVVSAGQKQGHFQRMPLKALQDLFGADPAVAVCCSCYLGD